ncbi:oxidoreductase [Mycobacterium sp. MBM]|nr:oxidoreductase [Mycobacterium sp. MBM]
MTGWTALDLPTFSGRTVVVTGANSGLGAATARELARAGAKVVLAVRNPDKGVAAAKLMRGDVEVRQLDLQDLSSVRAFAADTGRVDVLINNAGIMAAPYTLTVDGFESQIGTNHLGHFALTNLLLPKLVDRVVTVSSLTHWRGGLRVDDLNWKTRKYDPYLAYGQSKLANLLFTSELQRRLQAAGSTVRALAAHPGYSATDLMKTAGGHFGDVLASASKILATDADFGARQTLFAAAQDLPGDTFVGPRFGIRGRSQAVRRSGAARDAATAARLWRVSEQLTGIRFPL